MVETVIEGIQLGAGLARVEFLDDKQIEAINRYSHIALPVLPTLFFEFHGISKGEVEELAPDWCSLSLRSTEAVASNGRRI